MNYNLTKINPFGVILTPRDQSIPATDIEIGALRLLFLEHQLVVLRGFEPFLTTEALTEYCQLWGKISLWPFGMVLDLIEQINPKDHIFDHSYMPLHWDGMYRKELPEYQIFYCVKAPVFGAGGRTTFSNTLLALKNASNELRSLWQKVVGIYQRKMEFYHSKTVSKVITKHPYKDFSVIRYSEPHILDNGHLINPPDVKFIGLSDEDLLIFHQTLKESLYSPWHFYAHQWQTGDIVIADNFSLLHGREAFISQSPRHLKRVHVLSDPPFDNPSLEFCQ